MVYIYIFTEVATKKLEDVLFNVHIIHQQDHRTHKTLHHVSYSCLYPMIFPQHPITLSV
jgi:hypothetical protein